METPQDGTTNYYVLSKVNDNFGFFKLSSTKKLGAHKAYLEVAPSNNAPEYLGFDETTAINEHELHESHELSGEW